MSNGKRQLTLIHSISQLHKKMGLKKPEHPLISLISVPDLLKNPVDNSLRFVTDFYIIAMKRNVLGKIVYGQQYYDFDEGIVAFMAPGQSIFAENADGKDVKGWLLVFHPDFIRSYPLAKTIKSFGFFSYSVNEALHLSAKEEKMLERIMKNIQQEYHSSIDKFSQDVMVSHIDLLLNYANRFYNRQFLTRKTVSNDILIKLDGLLSDYFNSDNVQKLGLPSVQYISNKLNVSANYLSDMLRNLTGQSTQQHIHDKLIEKAKERLSTSELSVSEIAYELGFEHPQSFSKLFKSKTNQSPLEFRHSFN
jgi:AraC family transcriptional regulator, transcriptional activator of pobA